MEDPGHSYSNHNNSNLLSLAFDCNEMVNQLSRGLKLEFQGKHRSAVEELDLVKNQIEIWLDRLNEVDTEGLDKDQIVVNLEEAKQDVNLESQDR